MTTTLALGQNQLYKKLSNDTSYFCPKANYSDFYATRGNNGEFVCLGYFTRDTSNNALAYYSAVKFDSLGNMLTKVDDFKRCQSLFVLPDGKFMGFSPSENKYIQKFNADLTLDSSYEFDASSLSYIDFSSMNLKPYVVQKNGSAFIGGVNQSNERYRSVIHKLSSSGKVDSVFEKNCYKVSRYGFWVNSIACQSDGKILVALQTFENGALPSIIRLKVDGSIDSSFHSVNVGRLGVQSIFIDRNDAIFIQGDFSMVDGYVSNKFCKLLPNGNFDKTFTVKTGFDFYFDPLSPSIQGFYELPNGKIFINGNFNAFQGANLSKFCVLNPDGSLWNGLQLPEVVKSLNQLFNVIPVSSHSYVTSSKNTLYEFVNTNSYQIKTKIANFLVQFSINLGSNVQDKYSENCKLNGELMVVESSTNCNKLNRKYISVILDSSYSGMKYSWYLNGELLNDEADKILISQNGQYSLEITGANECYYQPSPIITNVNIQDNLIDDSLLIMLDTLNTECGHTYIGMTCLGSYAKQMGVGWFDSNNKLIHLDTIATSEKKLFHFDSSGVYTIKAVDDFGCSLVKDINVVVAKIRGSMLTNVFNKNCDSTVLSVQVSIGKAPFELNIFYSNSLFKSVELSDDFIEIPVEKNKDFIVVLKDKNNCSITNHFSTYTYEGQIVSVVHENYGKARALGSVTIQHDYESQFIEDLGFWIDNKQIDKNTNLTHIDSLTNGNHFFTAKWNNELACEKTLEFYVNPPSNGLNDTIIYACKINDEYQKVALPTDQIVFLYEDTLNPVIQNSGLASISFPFSEVDKTWFIAKYEDGFVSRFSNLYVKSIPNPDYDYNPLSKILKIDSSLFQGFSIRWYKAGQLISENNFSISVSDINTSYQVSISDPQGCNIVLGQDVYPSLMTYNKDILNHENDSLYPNPMQNFLIVNYYSEVYDLMGKMLLSGDGIIDVSQLCNGVFIVKQHNRMYKVVKN